MPKIEVPTTLGPVKVTVHDRAGQFAITKSPCGAGYRITHLPTLRAIPLPPCSREELQPLLVDLASVPVFGDGDDYASVKLQIQAALAAHSAREACND